MLLAFRHGLQRRVGGRFGGGIEQAGVLDREKSLGNVDVEHGRDGDCGKGHKQHQEADPQHSVQRHLVKQCDGVDHAIDTAGKQAGMRIVIDRFQQAGAEHRRQGQRDKPRNQDGHRNRHGEFAENAPNDTAHQQHRDEHSHQRQGDRQNGEANFPSAFQRRLERLHAFLDMADNVLEHHNGIIDDKADRQRQGQQ